MLRLAARLERLRRTVPSRKRPGGLPSRREVLEFLKRDDSPTARADIARAFGVKGADRPALRALLKEVEEDGTLARQGRARFADASSLPPVLPLDIMSVDEDGDLVCLPAGWEGASEPPLIRLSSRSAARTKPAPGVGTAFSAHFDRQETTATLQKS